MLRPPRRLAAALLACALASALAACSPGAPSAPDAARTATPAPPPAPGAGLEAQAAWLKGSAVSLTPIPGASRWLASPKLAAYRDASGAECVFDAERGEMLSWEPSLRTVASTNDTWQPEGYGVTVGAAAKQADVKAREAHKGDIAAMRRTVQLDEKGAGPVYVFQYDRYVNGVRVPDHVTVDCAGATGAAGFTAFYTKPSGAASGFRPKVRLTEAASKAAAAVGLTRWRFVSAELYLEPMAGKTAPKVVWAIAVADTSSADAAAKLAIVDPLTGEASAAE